MTSIDKIEQRQIAPTNAARAYLSVELIETLKLAIPIALTQLGQIAMMTTDLALIGRLGDAAVAAAALAHTVFFLSFTFGLGPDAGGGAPRGASLWRARSENGAARVAGRAMGGAVDLAADDLHAAV